MLLKLRELIQFIMKKSIKKNYYFENMEKMIKKFNQNGFIILRNFLTQKKINQVKKDLFIYLKKNNKNFTSKEINLVNKGKVNSLHNLKNFIHAKDLKKNIHLKQIAEKLLGEEVEDMGSELFAKPAKFGLKSPAHQDNYYWCLKKGNALTVWIALNDASKKNGGIYYYVGSHKKNIYQHKPSFAPGSSQTVKQLSYLKKYKVFFPKLKSGDCLIHHSKIVHGSNENKSNKDRKGLTVRFKAKTDKRVKSKHLKYLRDLREQIKKRAIKRAA